jgi:dTDP-4-dehydrorhamnose reductase
MRVGIIGYKGFVGSALYTVFSNSKNLEVVGIGRAEYPDYVGKNFDVLINANGNSSKLLAEREPKKDFEMNVLATLNSLRDFSFNKYVYVSTIDIYCDKSASESTSEDAIISPSKLSNYGFSKYLGEILTQKYAVDWLILRLGGMVGENMKKGPAYDILNLQKLFVSSKSHFQFINTHEVANITKYLIENNRMGIYNIVGDGNIQLSDFAALAKIKLTSEGTDVMDYNVSCGKLKLDIKIPSTMETIETFLASRRDGVV